MSNQITKRDINDLKSLLEDMKGTLGHISDANNAMIKVLNKIEVNTRK